jgi:ADP-ribose pyrophosphatase YjhB (NUDIX family)
MTQTIGTVCFIVKDRQVLLAEIQYPDGRKLWNGIGGVVEPDETPAATVSREISEETKLLVSPSEVAPMTVVESETLQLHVFVAWSWHGELEAVDPTLKQLRWFKFDEVPYDQMHEGNNNWLPRVLEQSVPQLEG